MYVPSSELGPPQPLSRKRVCPPPQTKGWGAHSPAAKGVGESQFRRLEKKLSTLPTLWSIATSPPFGSIEGQKWFDQISSQWESQKNLFAFISFGKVQFLPPCIWNLPFMSYRLWSMMKDSRQYFNLPFLGKYQQRRRKMIFCHTSLKISSEKIKMIWVMWRVFTLYSFVFLCDEEPAKCARFSENLNNESLVMIASIFLCLVAKLNIL